MIFHFPTLRFPSFREILGLFFVPTRVDGIIAGIQRQEQALENAIFHHSDVADLHAQDAADHHMAQLASIEKSQAAKDEAARAARVAGKLADLIA